MTGSTPTRSSRREDLRLLLLFGGLYFVQGVVEPTECLPSQPLQTSLRTLGLRTADIGTYLGVIGLAWSLKPAYGALSDFFPLFGKHRWWYLVVSTAACGLGFAALAMSWGNANAVLPGRWLLLSVGVAIAFSDVVIDAVAVEQGNPRGLTGRIQAVQWGANSLATVLAGLLGGWLAERKGLSTAFGLCAVFGFASFALVLAVYREPRGRDRPTDNLRTALSELRVGNRVAILAAVAAFLFLWNFNPFTRSVLQTYSTEELGFSQQFYGALVSVQAVAEVGACVLYGFICRRIAFGKLLHISILTGIASTLAYLFMIDRVSAVAANIVFGFTYQLGMLVTMDLAARACPIASAGTTFAILMAVCNTALSAAMYLGGGWYESLGLTLGSASAGFNALVLVGAACTAACWLVVPVMKRAGVPWD
ncbi:MAG TPA: MFS transporter [Polyangiales bacterium]